MRTGPKKQVSIKVCIGGHMGCPHPHLRALLWNFSHSQKGAKKDPHFSHLGSISVLRPLPCCCLPTSLSVCGVDKYRQTLYSQVIGFSVPLGTLAGIMMWTIMPCFCTGAGGLKCSCLHNIPANRDISPATFSLHYADSR